MSSTRCAHLYFVPTKSVLVYDRLTNRRNIPVLHRVFAATCTSVAVSGVGDLDGTYSDTPFYSSSLDGWDYYATRNEGTETYELKGSGHLWWIRHIDGTLAYRVSNCRGRRRLTSYSSSWAFVAPGKMVLSARAMTRAPGTRLSRGVPQESHVSRAKLSQMCQCEPPHEQSLFSWAAGVGGET